MHEVIGNFSGLMLTGRLQYHPACRQLLYLFLRFFLEQLWKTQLIKQKLKNSSGR